MNKLVLALAFVFCGGLQAADIVGTFGELLGCPSCHNGMKIDYKEKVSRLGRRATVYVTIKENEGTMKTEYTFIKKGGFLRWGGKWKFSDNELEEKLLKSRKTQPRPVAPIMPEPTRRSKLAPASFAL